ncbi:hypothetical protein [Pricia sp.]|uniref:hypothetical protein n=1 Tax=Pricia sp. TaxID=2268138 RepID=UPI0035939D96
MRGEITWQSSSMVGLFEGHPSHEVANGRFRTLVQVDVVLFQPVVASARANMIMGLFLRLKRNPNDLGAEW